MNIRLKEQDKIRVSTASDVFGIMQRILLRESKRSRNKEHFWTISLDNSHRIINIELVSLGTVNKTLVDPVEVLSIPLQKRAVKLIFVHNHPSGQLDPSEEDKDITDNLIQAAQLMHLEVIEHLIISEESYYSFALTGLLEELRASLKYVPPFIIKKRQEEARIKQAEKNGKKVQAREIARKMKKEGVDPDTISLFTGISKASIANLKTE